MKKDKRKRYFINRYFQGRFILTFFLISSIGGVLVIVLFNLLSLKKLELLMYSVHIPANSISDILSAELIYANIVAFLFVLLALVIAITRTTNRMAGPLYRIKNELERIAAGDLSCGITLRESDEFRDFAQDINTMVDSLKLLYMDIKNEIEIIDRCAAEMKNSGKEVKVLRNKIHRHLNMLRARVKDLKV